jgi:hypothetical protein
VNCGKLILGTSHIPNPLYYYWLYIRFSNFTTVLPRSVYTGMGGKMKNETKSGLIKFERKGKKR